MPTNVQWLETIHQELTQWKADLEANRLADIQNYRLPMLESVQALAVSLTTEQGLAAFLLAQAVTKQDQILTTLQSWDQLLQDVRANLEFINQNGSQNAQNQQILTLSAASACCEDVTPTEGVPADMCARARAVVDTVLNRADTLCSLAASSTIPTLEELRDILRRDEWHTATAPMYTDSELVDIQGAIAARGIIGLSELCDIMNNTQVAERAYNTIFNAGSSQAASTAMAAQYFFDLGIPAPWDRFIRYLFPASVIDLIFNSNVAINTDNFSNEGCETEPEPSSCNNQQVLIPHDVTHTSDFDFTIAPGVEGQVGDDFEFQVTSWNQEGGTVFLESLPFLNTLGNASVGSPFRWTITPGMTGARASFFQNNEEVDNFVEYRKCMYPGDPV